MKEKTFYGILDECEAIRGKVNLTKGYFPLVEELTATGVNIEDNLDNYAPLILYFATDPFKEEDLLQENRENYRNTVNFCKDLALKIPLTK